MTSPSPGLPAFDLAIRGEVSATDRDYAHDKLMHVAERGPVRAMLVHGRLTQEADPARERPAVVEATVELTDGRVVRAHLTAATMREAIDLAEARLLRQLRMVEERVETLHRRAKRELHDPHEWRHGDPPNHRPPFFDRPAEEREVLRHKSPAVVPQTADEAAYDMELLGHTFYHFESADTGADTVVYVRSDGRYGLLDTTGAPEVPADAVGAFVPGSRVPTRWTLDDARELLDLDGDRFVFFVDDESGRGAVLYRRYDGHYGLITPASSST